MEEKKKVNAEETQETKKQGAQVAPSATFLNSMVLSVRLADCTMRHIQFSIFEEDESHQIRIFYDVINPADVKFNK
jgi:hypothetical protein